MFSDYLRLFLGIIKLKSKSQKTYHLIKIKNNPHNLVYLPKLFPKSELKAGLSFYLAQGGKKIISVFIAPALPIEQRKTIGVRCSLFSYLYMK